MDRSTPYYQIRKKIIFDLLEKYPDTSTRGLSRIVARDFPEFFKDAEEARTHIRVYTGKSGGAMRERIKMRKYYKS